jgi:hypothetical protein
MRHVSVCNGTASLCVAHSALLPHLGCRVCCVWADCVDWLCGLIVWTDCVGWLCGLIVWADYVGWVCGLIVLTDCVDWVCGLIVAKVIMCHKLLPSVGLSRFRNGASEPCAWGVQSPSWETSYLFCANHWRGMLVQLILSSLKINKTN